MKLKLISIILSLALMLSLFSALVSCNKGGEGETTEGESTSGEESVSGNESESETEPDIETDTLDDIVYENGGTIKAAGLQWNVDAFASEEHSFDESKAVVKTAAEMLELLLDFDKMAEGEVYRVTEPLVLESNMKYYGNLATVIADGGIIIKDVENIVIKELIVKGDITVESSKSVTFFKLDLKGGAVGVSIDDKSSSIAFKSSKIYATDVAVKTDAPTTFYQCYLNAGIGVIGSANDTIVQDTQVLADTVGISLSGEYCTVKNCLIEASTDGIGVSIAEGAQNALVTLNVIRGVQKSVKVVGGFNCVVLLNSAIRIIGENNVNLYIVENNLGGAIELTNNKYLLCDANVLPSFADDGKEHPVVNTDNTDYNGNNMHDVNARLEYGADENLLPHTNKDLFMDMERRTLVSDLSLTKSYGIKNYMRTMAKENSIVIVPPGAYTTDNYIRLDAAHSNTTLYGFGAYIEKTTKTQVFYFVGISNCNVRGFTLGYSFQSAGQIHVVDKIGGTRLLVITNAGYVNGYGRTDLDTFAAGTSYMYKAGELAPWNNFGGSYQIIQQNDDGTMVLELTGTDAAKLYSSIGKGDVFSCRLSGDNSNTVYLSNCHGVDLKDCVIYGYSSALAIVGNNRATGLSLERVHNTVHSPYYIDKETYDKYVQLEETYGVDLEVYVDENGKYRGGIPRVGSVDATHIQGATEGMDATSCIFENMCDDASNQRSSSARVTGYHHNGDGTTTIYFKGSISETYWDIATNARRDSATPSSCTIPLAGERIYAYASTGHILFDTVALTAAKKVTSSPLCHIVHMDNLVNSEIKEGDITDINGSFTQAPKCIDGLCDVCGKVTHVDKECDGKCDLCNAKVHTDWKLSNNDQGADGRCDVGGCIYKHDHDLVDADGDSINDADGIPIIYDQFYISQFIDTNGHLEVTAGYPMEKWYVITYKMDIYEVLVSTDSLDQKALEVIDGMDLTDNEHRMDNKVLFDNLSANSVGFTFDNVLVRDKVARGILCKTHDVVIKNCTFQSFSSAAMLMSVETTWGESTVPRNVLITGCLFDDTGRSHGVQNNPLYACIAINGLGANSGKAIDVSAESLPCKQISIIGNKFINVNNKYAISISAAQDILIKDNVFESSSKDTANSYSKAILINGAMNITVMGNTYPSMANGEAAKSIVANNYKNLTGSDVEGIFPNSKDPN